MKPLDGPRGQCGKCIAEVLSFEELVFLDANDRNVRVDGIRGIDVQRVWLGKPNEKYLNLPDINPREIAMLVPLGIIVVVLGVYPHAILDLIDTSLQHLNSTVLAAGKAAGAVAAAAPGAVTR